MKRIIALVLIAVTALAVFASCEQPTTDDPKITTAKPDNNDPIIDPANQFVDVDETVYVYNVKTSVNVRKTPNSNSETNNVGTLKYGDEVKRTGINETTGWSRIVFKGAVAYVVSECLTKTKPAEVNPHVDPEDPEAVVAENLFKVIEGGEETELWSTSWTEKNEYIHDTEEQIRVYLKAYDNWSEVKNKIPDTKVTLFDDGTVVKRVAVYYSDEENDPTIGWSKIEITGKDNKTLTYFVRNSCIKVEVVKLKAAPTEED